MKKPTPDVRALLAETAALREFVTFVSTMSNDPKSRKGKRWDILSDCLNELAREAAALLVSLPLAPGVEVHSPEDVDEARALLREAQKRLELHYIKSRPRQTIDHRLITRIEEHLRDS